MPTPLGWRFTRYRFDEEAGFHNRRPASKLVVRSDCAGPCGRPLADNVRSTAREHERSQRNKPGFHSTGLEQVVPGLYRQRIETRAGGGPRAEVEAFAVPEGSDRLLRCSVEVEGKVDFEQREALDRWCVTVLRAWLETPDPASALHSR